MKYRILLIIFLFLLDSYSFPAESDQKIRELEKELKVAGGREKVDILNNLSKFYRKTDPEKSLSLNKSAVELSVRIHYPEGETYAYIHMGYTYHFLKDTKKAIGIVKKSLRLSERIKYKYGIMKANLSLANIYFRENNYDEALKYYLKAEKLCEGLKDIYPELINLFSYTGLTYYRIYDFNRALVYYKKGLKVSIQAKKKEPTARFYCYTGNIYSEMGKYNKALDYYKRSLKIFEELDNKIWIIRMKQNIGTEYGILKKYDVALSHLQDVLKRERIYGMIDNYCQTLLQIGELYIDKKQYKKADMYYKEVLENIGSFDNIAFKELFYKSYANLYYLMGKFKEAYDFLKKHIEIKDTTMNTEKSNKIAELQEKYDAEIRIKEIEILKRDKRIQQILFASGFLLVFIVIFFIFKKYMYLFAFWKRKNQIGHYRVVEKIASGGMGTIYKAHDIQDKTKELALKVLRDEFYSDESYKKRFKHEAVVIDQFSHPNIVNVLERGESGGNIYIAMELLDGKTLNKVLEDEEKFAIPTALNIMTQAADALAMIHKKKIIHRDLKPENIMIIKTEENPYFVKVLDFGLARQQALTRMTQTGIIMGSISYMSPERLTNSELTAASDIYSLGVIYYQMLSGEMLFLGDTVVDVARQILEKEPIPLNKLRKDIPAELNHLITKMINKEPEKRPTAKEVLDILKNIAAKEPESEIKKDRPNI